MAKRLKPSKTFVEAVTGRNQTLASSMAHGLRETPLTQLYEHLDFREAVIFAAATWQFRQNFSKFRDFAGRVNEPYDLFKKVFARKIPVTSYRGVFTYSNCFAWLNNNIDIGGHKAKFNRMNPFGKKLETRLENVDIADFETLKERLTEPVCEYIFDCQYQRKKMARG